jgi:hypothetical protein
LIYYSFSLGVVVDGIVRAYPDTFSTAVTGLTIDIIFHKGGFFAGQGKGHGYYQKNQQNVQCFHLGALIAFWGQACTQKLQLMQASGSMVAFSELIWTALTGQTPTQSLQPTQELLST